MVCVVIAIWMGKPNLDVGWVVLAFVVFGFPAAIATIIVKASQRR